MNYPSLLITFSTVLCSTRRPFHHRTRAAHESQGQLGRREEWYVLLLLLPICYYIYSYFYFLRYSAIAFTLRRVCRSLNTGLFDPSQCFIRSYPSSAFQYIPIPISQLTFNFLSHVSFLSHSPLLLFPASRLLSSTPLLLYLFLLLLLLFPLISLTGGWQLSEECTVVDAVVNTIGFPLVGEGEERKKPNGGARGRKNDTV
jgi:hypothetical protein